MKRTGIKPMIHVMSTLALLGGGLLSGGCVSKSDYEGLQAEIAECREEKVQAEAQVIAWEQRFDRESSRWEELEGSISEQVPMALSDLNAERERILEMVPEQVQSEVSAYLEEYFSTVMRGFDRLSSDNREVQLQLNATQKVLENLGRDTSSISTSIDSALADERSARQAEAEKRQEVIQRLAELVAIVNDFDSSTINCKGCPDQLRLKRQARETITSFHAELTARLADLQSFAAE